MSDESAGGDNSSSTMNNSKTTAAGSSIGATPDNEGTGSSTVGSLLCDDHSTRKRTLRQDEEAPGDFGLLASKVTRRNRVNTISQLRPSSLKGSVERPMEVLHLQNLFTCDGNNAAQLDANVLVEENGVLMKAKVSAVGGLMELKTIIREQDDAIHELHSTICVRGLYVQKVVDQDGSAKLVIRAHFGPKIALHFDSVLNCQLMYANLVPYAINARKLTDHYDLTDKMLGKGKFGKVFHAVHRYSGTQVAVKKIDKSHMMPEELELQRREIALLKLCQHPNIIQLIDYFEELDTIYVVTELMKCDLFEYLNGK